MMTTPNTATQSSYRTQKVANKPTREKQLHKLLTRKSGVTISQLQKTFGWQPHTARATISAQRNAGCVVERVKTEKGAIYRIVEAQSAR